MIAKYQQSHQDLLLDKKELVKKNHKQQGNLDLMKHKITLYEHMVTRLNH